MDEASPTGRHALILVENLPVPEDRRVWPECRALRRAGWEVTVICPEGAERHRDSHEVLEGVDIHRFRPAYAGGGVLSYAREYAVALWHTRRLVRKLAREQRFDIVHACNPPDMLLLVARPLRRRGARFVFDHHDLVPELYETRFGRGPLLRCALLAERIAFRLADVVLATNESFKRVALQRGGKRPEDVFVVRNGPALDEFAPGPADPAIRRGAQHLIAYVGTMGAQDGVDHAVRALALLAAERDDWRAVFVGDGTALAETRQLALDLGLADRVEFTGFADKPEVVKVLSSADICLAPEPKNVLNDHSTMIKVAEYMAMGCPVVAYDLMETRFSAGDAAAYADSGDPALFAARIAELLDDPERRRRMGASGRARVEQALAWEHSERSLIAAYEHALTAHPAGGRRRAARRRPRGARLAAPAHPSQRAE